MPRVVRPRLDRPEPVLRLRTLGTYECTLDGKNVSLPRKAFLLLAYLAMRSGRRVSRQLVIDLLWNGKDETKAKHSLSQVLYAIRKNLPNVAFDSSTDFIALAHPISIDVDDLFDAVRRNDITTALSLADGEFLEIDAKDVSHAFAEWRDNVAFRARVETDDLVIRQFDEAFAVGCWDDCVDLGNYLRAAGRLPSRVSDRLTTARHRLIEAKGNSSETDTSPPPFLGRTAEMSELHKLWALSVEGTPTLVVIQGDAGIGKTRLANHFARLAALNGACVVTCQCYEAERHVAYASLLQIVDQIVAEDSGLPAKQLEALRILRPGTAEDGDAGGWGPASKALLFDALASSLRARAKSRPILLWFDDVQWCDDSSSEWIHYYLRTSDDRGGMIFACKRVDSCDITPHINWIDHHPSTSPIRVSTMPESDARCLIHNCLTRSNKKLAPADIDWIDGSCKGHPLYIVALTRALIDGTEDDIRALTKGTAVPSAIRRLVEYKYSRVSEGARNVVEVLSCVGGFLSIQQLATYSGFPPPQLAMFLRELSIEKLINENKLEVSHDLVRQAIYSSMAPVIRQLRHTQIYEGLSEFDPPAVRSLHAFRANMRSAAYEESLKAAASAEKISAFAEAQFHLNIALQCSDDRHSRMRVMLQLTDLTYGLNRSAEVVPFLPDLESWCHEVHDEDGALLCCISRVNAELAANTVPASVAMATIKELIYRAAELSKESRLVQAIRLAFILAHHTSNKDELFRLSAQVERMSDKLSLSSRSEILSSASAVLAPLHLERALSLADDAVLLARQVGEPRILIRALSARGSVRIFAGQIEQALSDFNDAEAEFSDEGLSDLMYIVHANRACVWFDQGKFIEARSENQRAMSCVSHHRILPFLNEAAGCLAENDYEGVMKWGERAISENILLGAPWINVVARSLIGLALLELQRLTEARFMAALISDILSSSESIMISDWSYTASFLAKIDAANGNVFIGRQRLERALQNKNHDPFAKCRIELSLAAVALPSDPDLAYHLAKTAKARAVQVGSEILAVHASEVLADVRLLA